MRERGERWSRLLGRARSGAIAWGIFVAGGLAAAPASALGQGLAEFDYENLGFRGIGPFVGKAWPTTVESTVTYGVRMDLGYLGPGVRILPTFTYWSSPFTRDQIRTFEERIEELVRREQDPSAPPATVDLGRVTWTDLSLGVDGQMVWSTPIPVMSYLGGGFAAHILNGEGPAVNDTFVEDLLDRVAIGINLHAGAEWAATDHFRVFGEGRAEFVENVRYFEFRSGVSFFFGPSMPGERP